MAEITVAGDFPASGPDPLDGSRAREYVNSDLPILVRRLRERANKVPGLIERSEWAMDRLGTLVAAVLKEYEGAPSTGAGVPPYAALAADISAELPRR